MEAAHEISWRPLGELFVEKGLLTEENLEQALADQAATGGRLGDKLVELGYVTRHALARLLAEQTGVEFDVDSGFGTGLLAELQRRKDGSSEAPAAPAEEETVERYQAPRIFAVPPPPTSPQPNGLSTFAALEELWARLAAAESKIGELERELRTIKQSAY